MTGTQQVRDGDRPHVFTAEQIAELNRGRDSVWRALRLLPGDVAGRWAAALKSNRAREYLTQGVGRRLKIIQRCFEQVFTLCPADRTELLNGNDRTDIEIYLHAFVINVHGLLDNVAWVAVFEAAPNPLPKRVEVSLFKPAVQQYLPEAARKYLGSDVIRAWHGRYAVVYRDALAHRVPLYVPPAYLVPEDQKKYRDLEERIAEKMKALDPEAANALTREQARVGQLLPGFQHSYEDEDKTNPVLFHPQLIADMKSRRTATSLSCGRQCASPTTNSGMWSRWPRSGGVASREEKWVS